MILLWSTQSIMTNRFDHSELGTASARKILTWINITNTKQ